MTALRLLLAAGVLLATVGKSDAQQQKRDIFGITTGVPEAQIDALLTSANIKCFAARGSSTRRCETRGGDLSLVFTERLQPKRLYFIMFEFLSGAPFKDVVKSISEQYGQQATMVLRGREAEYFWLLEPKLKLKLTSAVPGVRYELRLEDESLDSQNEAAREKASPPAAPKF